VRYLTDRELQTFLKAAGRAGRKWDAFWSMTYFFAMRAGETAALKVADVDLASHQVTVRAEKGGTSRVYDLPEQIERKLKAWLKERADNPEHEANEFLFPSRLLPRSGHLTNESAGGPSRGSLRRLAWPARTVRTTCGTRGRPRWSRREILSCRSPDG
jgi:integrase